MSTLAYNKDPKLLKGPLPSWLCNRYSAAGVLIYTKDEEGRLLLLLGKEERRNANREVWLHFSGKKETIDYSNPSTTAYRELMEETCSCLNSQQLRLKERLRSRKTSRIWFPSSRYVLYLMYIPYDASIPESFLKAKESRSYRCKESFQSELAWIPYTTILDCFDKNIETFVGQDGKTEYVYRWFLDLMKAVCIFKLLLN
jgi:hypothetical protein